MTSTVNRILPNTLCLSAILAFTIVYANACAVDFAEEKPNIVFIFVDYMGYGDIGPFGNTINKTPNLNRMAEEGLVLTQFCVSNTACTPSRSALMTGTYAHRIGMDGNVVFPGIQLLVDNKMVRSATGQSLKNPLNEEIIDWQSFDVAEFIGKEAVLKIVDNHSGGWGHTVVDHIFQSDTPMPSSIPENLTDTKIPGTQPADPGASINATESFPPPKPGVMLKDEWSTFPLYDQVGYDQALRPQFHFTSRMGWLNDPNGMVFYDGEWHMCFYTLVITMTE